MDGLWKDYIPEQAMEQEVVRRWYECCKTSKLTDYLQHKKG